MDAKRLETFVDNAWDAEIVPELVTYVKIPALSPHFDADWKANGHLDEAVEHIRSWCAKRSIAGLTVEVVTLGERTPVIYMEIPAFSCESDKTVLLYGHLDKQPEMQGWDEGKGPWIPVIENDKLYGRGGADDGYAAYGSLTAIEALQEQGIAHSRCVVLIEACEESGSYDLPAYVDELSSRMGEIDLVICLDSGCGDYERLWSTTSLRGLIAGTVSVEVLEPPKGSEHGGVHSGDAGGIVPSSFRVLRILLDRISDPVTGELRLPELHAEIPEQRKSQAKEAASVLGEKVWAKFPFIDGMKPMHADATGILGRTWRPALEVVGIQAPDLTGGNVLRSKTAAKLSVRLPPTTDSVRALDALRKAILADPPYGARIKFEGEKPADGWNAPPTAAWVDSALAKASEGCFGPKAVHMGEGGTIPFMGMLGAKFPGAQFVITGVLGPGSNAHGPNEFLHIPTGKRVTRAMSYVLAEHARR